MKAHLLVCIGIAVPLLLSGCGSTLVLQSKGTEPAATADRPLVFVRNPELVREYGILRDAGIYQLTEDKNCPTQLTLHPIRQHGRCGNPLLGGAFTLGLLPVILPAAQSFVYEMNTPVRVERCEHWLPLVERFSIWEWLIPQDEDKAIVRALARSERQTSR